MMKSLALAALATFALVTPSYADGAWAGNHPRRAEVNRRLANQNARINGGVRDGTLTGKQAATLHREDRAIRQEERADASLYGGHITKQEQRVLNRQENQVSRQIYAEKHGN
jgi:hypothetical protein